MVRHAVGLLRVSRLKMPSVNRIGSRHSLPLTSVCVLSIKKIIGHNNSLLWVIYSLRAAMKAEPVFISPQYVDMGALNGLSGLIRRFSGLIKFSSFNKEYKLLLKLCVTNSIWLCDPGKFINSVFGSIGFKSYLNFKCWIVLFREIIWFNPKSILCWLTAFLAQSIILSYK